MGQSLEVKTLSHLEAQREIYSSQANNGTSLNEILSKGPNFLNPLLNNIICFRGLSCYISKAYNSLKTGIVERNVRRILFRKNPN